MSDSTPVRLSGSPSSPLSGSASRVEPMAIGFSWFPADEFPEALRRWPELADSWAVADFATYCRQLQKRLLRYAASSAAEDARVSLRVAPIRLVTFLPWCDERGLEPGEAMTRSNYAADRVRVSAADVVAWPPARNERCWCGSGRKYTLLRDGPGPTRRVVAGGTPSLQRHTVHGVRRAAGCAWVSRWCAWFGAPSRG